MTVSVIIPIYNVSAYIERCIHSVMNQTYTSLECIFVDDCGTDDSIEKCEQLISEYKGNIRFKIIHHEYNRGLSAARNTGTETAIGDYILYVDSDDEITTDCVEKLVKNVESYPGVELVQGMSRSIPPKRRSSHVHKPFVEIARTNDDVRACFYNHQLIITAWNKLISRDFIMRHQLLFKEGVLYEDTPWMFNMVKHLSYVSFSAEVTYHYYVRPDSITLGTDFHTSAVHRLTVMEDVLAHLTLGKENEELQYYGTELCKYYAKYRQDVKEYDNLFRMFCHLSRQHHCVPCLTVSAAYIVGHVPYAWYTLRYLRRSCLRLKIIK